MAYRSWFPRRRRWRGCCGTAEVLVPPSSVSIPHRSSPRPAVHWIGSTISPRSLTRRGLAGLRLEGPHGSRTNSCRSPLVPEPAALAADCLGTRLGAQVILLAERAAAADTADQHA